MKIVELVRTCIACPSQWDAKLDDGRWAYLRFRFNNFTMCVGEDVDSAVSGECVLHFEWGEHSMAGDMSNSELVEELIKRGVEVDLECVPDEEDWSWEGLEQRLSNKDEEDEQ